MVLLVAVALVAGFAWFAQWQQAQTLKAEIALARDQQEELLRVKAENQRARAATRVEVDLEALRADHRLVEGLRSEVEALRQRALVSASKASPVKPQLVAESRNLGRVTPRASLETLLWTLGHRDEAAMAGMLTLAPEVRSRAQTAFERLPPEVKETFGSLENSVAAMAVRSLRIDEVTVNEESGSDERRALKVNFREPSGGNKHAQLDFVRTPEGWQLLVPETNVNRYLAMAAQAK